MQPGRHQGRVSELKDENTQVLAGSGTRTKHHQGWVVSKSGTQTEYHQRQVSEQKDKNSALTTGPGFVVLQVKSRLMVKLLSSDMCV